MSKLMVSVVLDGTAAAVVKQVINTFVPGGEFTGVRVNSIVPFLLAPAEGVSDSQTKNNGLFAFVGYGSQTAKGNDTLNELLVAQSVVAIEQLTSIGVGLSLNTSNVVTGFSIGQSLNWNVIGMNLLSKPIDVITDLTFGVASLTTLSDMQNLEVHFLVEYESIRISDKSYLAVTQLQNIV